MEPTVPLLRHIDQRFDDLWKRIDDRFAAQDKASALAERRLDARLEGMNEIRRQLDTQAATFATKEGLEGRVRPLEKFQDNLTGRMVVVGGLVALVGGGMVALVLRIFLP